MLPYPEEPVIPSGPATDTEIPSATLDCYRQLTQNNLSTDEDPFAYLNYFDTAFLIDDSESMLSHWSSVEMLLQRIADICIKHDKNGIDIYFVNHRPRSDWFHHNYGYKNIGCTTGMLEFHDNVAGIFNNVRPRGKCRLGATLWAIFNNYMTDLKMCRHATKHKKFMRPLNLIVVTAGHIYNNPFETLTRVAKELDKLDAPRHQVGVQFFYLGNDPHNQKGLEFADDQLHKQENTRDIVDMVTWSGKPGELSAEAVLKTVLGSVRKSLDEMPVSVI
ncbi:hypothetical protein DL771_002659 [Monosporascus sp. 5C6A]|nr:hypothetical protein DL771_002659 [Monosporascus sp. 5C6A]